MYVLGVFPAWLTGMRPQAGRFSHCQPPFLFFGRCAQLYPTVRRHAYDEGPVRRRARECGMIGQSLQQVVGSRGLEVWLCGGEKENVWAVFFPRFEARGG